MPQNSKLHLHEYQLDYVGAIHESLDFGLNGQCYISSSEAKGGFDYNWRIVNFSQIPVSFYVVVTQNTNNINEMDVLFWKDRPNETCISQH